jgi:hypothetical protein
MLRWARLNVFRANQVHGPFYMNPSYHAILGAGYEAGAGRSLQISESRKHNKLK